MLRFLFLAFMGASVFSIPLEIRNVKHKMVESDDAKAKQLVTFSETIGVGPWSEEMDLDFIKGKDTDALKVDSILGAGVYGIVMQVHFLKAHRQVFDEVKFGFWHWSRKAGKETFALKILANIPNRNNPQIDSAALTRGNKYEGQIGEYLTQRSLCPRDTVCKCNPLVAPLLNYWLTKTLSIGGGGADPRFTKEVAANFGCTITDNAFVPQLFSATECIGAVYLMEEEQGTVRDLVRGLNNDVLKKALLLQMAVMLKFMHHYGINHNDLHLGNLLYKTFRYNPCDAANYFKSEGDGECTQFCFEWDRNDICIDAKDAGYYLVRVADFGFATSAGLHKAPATANNYQPVGGVTDTNALVHACKEMELGDEQACRDAGLDDLANVLDSNMFTDVKVDKKMGACEFGSNEPPAD